KLWSDQDVTTAAALLKSADASLADMNDPSLITARRAITDDIAISLAHNGILFLDELPEFERRTLDALREPIESGQIHLSRTRAK
ncbi:uroporphyrinogen-III C-methyltransferase, partial [Salmonella enterica subsp. enterica serovar Montevideo]|nr:uroporphyrinogen-III C-methyltransferase [Salmonella enterica subsp. enterica serovar Montevideo]